MVARTVFVVVLITVTVPEPLLALYRRVPARLSAGRYGLAPTGTVATTAPAAVSMTEMVPDV
ncbi:unannotated protein [freshwater metagenome]|uniref:Unannotated protein n=1 Tax=freshwater metagenome TaxID=449393 RepID=A0A6J7MZ88_9ZZZZ